MAAPSRPRQNRSRQPHRPGQSLALIALVLVVLFGVAGLAVDVGDAYMNQRSLDQAASAAALAGMNYVAQQKASTANFSDSDVRNVIGKALLVNDVPSALFVSSTSELEPGQVGVIARYMDKNGNWLRDVGSLGASPPPANTWYISVQLRTPVATYFARVVGTDRLRVSAFATAGICPPIDNVYPLAIDTSKAPLATPSGTQLTLTRANGAASGDFNWLQWQHGSGDPALNGSLTRPGNLSDGFGEGTPGAGSQNGAHAGTLEVNDWVWGYQTTASSANSQLQALKQLQSIILPLFDGSAGSGADTSYHVNRLGLFQIQSIAWKSSSTEIKLKYLGEATGDVCQASPPDTNTKTYAIIGHVGEIRAKKQIVNSVGPVDVQIVSDISGSMLMGWECNTYDCVSKPNRRIDGSLPALRTFVSGMFEPNADLTPSNVQLALVTFGTKTDASTWSAKLVQDFVGVDGQGQLLDPGQPLNPDTSDTWSFPQKGYGTPTAWGVKLGIENLKTRATKRADSTGSVRKVKKVLLLVTDGLANMTVNGKDNCVSKTPGISVPTDCTSDVNWQSTMALGYLDPPNSPIGKTIALMDDARASGIEVFVVAAALQSNDPHSLKFDLMASNPLDTHLYNARSSAEIGQMIRAIKDIIFSTCTAVQEPLRNAAGAQVILHDANTGDVISTTTADLSGNYSFATVEPGRNYTIEIKHADVLGNDNITRTYDVMYVNASQIGPLALYVDPALPGKLLASDVTLRLNEAQANAICPAE